jgi:alanyl-tRNA synthetase
MTERLYYDNAHLTVFSAHVTRIEEVSRTAGQSVWRIALDRSAFYPTSGGQPHDRGTLTASSRSGAALVASVEAVEEDDHGEVWHYTAKPLTAGTEVQGAIDWARRLDHMQQHTGQHLLSSALMEIAQAPTVSFHLGETLSTIDLAVEQLTRQTLEQAEEFANSVIAEDRPVSVYRASREQAERWLAEGLMRKLPPRSGDLRIVEIPGDPRPLDRNACGGTHVASTGVIGGLHIRGLEKVRQGWRVEFVCGLRAMRAARQDYAILSELSRMVSEPFGRIAERLRSMQAEARQAARTLDGLTAELAGYRAGQMVQSTPVENGRMLVQQRFTSEEQGVAKQLATKISAHQKAAALFACEGSADLPAAVLLAANADLEIDCGTLLREAVMAAGGRGGGSRTMAQGSVPNAALEETLQRLKKTVLHQTRNF